MPQTPLSLGDRRREWSWTRSPMDRQRSFFLSWPSIFELLRRDSAAKPRPANESAPVIWEPLKTASSNFLLQRLQRFVPPCSLYCWGDRHLLISWDLSRKLRSMAICNHSGQELHQIHPGFGERTLALQWKRFKRMFENFKRNLISNFFGKMSKSGEGKFQFCV